MFGHKKSDAKPAEKVQMINLRLLDDEGSFSSDGNTEIEVRGFEVGTADNEMLYLSESGPVIEGLYYFRLAGATFHKGANRLDGNLGQEILVVHEPTNPHDPNAIQVLFDSEIVGYVPAELAKRMIDSLTTAKFNGKNFKGSQGMVTKTFHKRGRVVAAELLVVANGYGVDATSEPEAPTSTSS